MPAKNCPICGMYDVLYYRTVMINGKIYQMWVCLYCAHEHNIKNQLDKQQK